MEKLSIRNILSQVAGGQLRIPAFQRGFVWDANRVAHLMDSLYKGYPVGSVLIWRTRERLKTERDLGPFRLPEPKDQYPTDYVLDGQQRITSLFGVFQTELTPHQDVDWMNVFFDLDATEDLQESQVVALPREEAESARTRYFPLAAMFDTTGYRRATKDLSNDQAARVDEIQAIFKETSVPVQLLTTEERAKVAIVFERINQTGVPLDTLQLLTAWTWSEEFDLQVKFDDLCEELAAFGFSSVGADTELLLRASAAVLANDPSTRALLGLNGSDVRERFDQIENGLSGAIDFLRKNLGVRSLSNLPYPVLLVPLSTYFASSGSEEIQVTDPQRQQIERWFWRSCFSRRYNSRPLQSLQEDVLEMKRLRRSTSSQLGEFKAPAVERSYFTDQVFRINNVASKTFALMLAQNKPRSFISGQKIDLGPVLQAFNRNEFHHLYPRRFLRPRPTDFSENCLANFAIISRADNRALGGAAPSEYVSKMPDDHHAILEAAFCDPELLRADDFAAFVDDRARRLAVMANELMGSVV